MTRLHEFTFSDLIFAQFRDCIRYFGVREVRESHDPGFDVQNSTCAVREVRFRFHLPFLPPMPSYLTLS